MSVSRHHADWLNLVEHSGPFFSLPVLCRVFSSGLDQRDATQAKRLREAYEVWQDNPTAPGQQHAWVMHVLRDLLSYSEKLIAEGQSIPPGLEARMAEMGETLRPELALLTPQGREGAEQAQMLISIYPPEQKLDKPVTGKHWKATPATRMMELLHSAGVALGLVTNGEHWMLVYAPRGETTGYASWYASLWLDEPITLRAFHSLLCTHRFFSTDAQNTPLGMLRESANDQQEVTDQLGYQVREAVEVLVQSFDALDKESGRKLLYGVEETTLYDASLTVMMRLVFLFSAEERGMLQLGNPLYDNNYALSTLQEQLQEVADRYGEEVLERRNDAWARLLATFRAVHGGVRHQDLSMPAYGGSLFDPDRYPFLEGRSIGSSWKNTAAEPLAINNRVVLHLLNALQRLRVKGAVAGAMAETRRVSFRALGVEQIGHVYEGLLDHTAVCASEPVLGLKGTSKKEPEIPLATLEALQSQGEDQLIAFLKDETGRSPSALKKLLAGSSLLDEHKLLIGCGQDHDLLNRIRPFAGLIREDSFERPLIVLPGSVYVTAGTTRRSTGTHYTPPSLTEPVVRHTLEPLVYQGPAEGWPREQWRLKTPKEILELKVCDMAMGSGAFLVQACRYLAERLVEAWDNEEQQHPNEVLITPEGGFSKGEPSERLVPIDAEERLAIARRIVADRCLYGVDINPMAVEMAKLSLWLITMDPKRPFSFLDHAFKCGDSLLGITSIEQLERFSLRPGKGTQHTFSTLNLWRHINEAKAKRIELELMPSDTPEQISSKNALYSSTEETLAKLSVAANALVAMELNGLKGRAYELDRERYSALVASFFEDGAEAIKDNLNKALKNRKPFHWGIAYPEVIARGGFDAFIGNPPFVGGQLISLAMGVDYRKYLVSILANDQRGSADFCAYFILRAAALLKENGMGGLIATNTIAEGETRSVGLAQLPSLKTQLISAISSMTWPGSAALSVAILWFRKGLWSGGFQLDGKEVEVLTSTLSLEHSSDSLPHRLAKNKGMAFKGSSIQGVGFLLSPQEAMDIISADICYKDVLSPYLGGKDSVQRVDGSPSRWAINFYDWPLERAEKYPICLSIARNLVKPAREKAGTRNKIGARRAEYWWRYDAQAKDLYEAIKDVDRVWVTPEVGKYIAAAEAKNSYIFSHKTVVFPTGTFAFFSVILSSIHRAWIDTYSGTLGGSTINYSIADAFETFPFPSNCLLGRLPRGVNWNNDSLQRLETIGEQYFKARSNAMLRREEGITNIYNRINDKTERSSDIEELRILYAKMDKCVYDAYGWKDLNLEYDFQETKYGSSYTISESIRREALRRILELNHQRYAEEVAAGLHENRSGKTSGAGKRNRKPVQVSTQVDMFSTQAGLFDVPEKPIATQTVASSSENALLSWLQQNPDWHGKEGILSGSGYPENRWNQGIKALLESGRVERMGERRGARYRIKQ